MRLWRVWFLQLPSARRRRKHKLSKRMISRGDVLNGSALGRRRKKDGLGRQRTGRRERAARAFAARREVSHAKERRRG